MLNANISTYNCTMNLDELSVLYHLMYQQCGTSTVNHLSDSITLFMQQSLPTVLERLSRSGYIELEGQDVHLTDFGLEYYEHVPQFR